MTALALALQLLVLGLHVVAPWRLAGLPSGPAAGPPDTTGGAATVQERRRRVARIPE